MELDNHNIVEIRLLPNSIDSFPSYADFIDYLRTKWTQRGGVYYFPSKSIKFAGDTLTLFQYAGKIVASAVMVNSVPGMVKDEDGEPYGGKYLFDPQSLCIYSDPISSAELSIAYPELGNFSQSKRIIPLGCLKDVIAILDEHGPMFVNR